MYEKIDVLLVAFWRYSWEPFHDFFLPSPTCRNCHEKFSEKDNIFWVFLLINLFDSYGYFSEVFGERTRVLNIASQILISYSYNSVLPLFCTKWRRPLGGSMCKLLELTSVCRFLSFVIDPLKWRISVACRKNLCKVKIFCPCLHVSDKTN